MKSIFVKLVNFQSHWDLTQTSQNTKETMTNKTQKKKMHLYWKTSDTKAAYIDITYPLHSLARNIPE